MTFEGIFLSCRPKLSKLVSRYLNRPSDIEDVLQETFLKSYVVWLREHIEKPENYLFRTARNISLSYLSSSNTVLTDYIDDLQLNDVLKSHDSVLSTLEREEKFNLFCAATRELPMQCRQVFVLKKVYGLSHSEISDRLGISINTTNKHLAKALAKLTVFMRENGYLESSSGQ